MASAAHPTPPRIRSLLVPLDGSTLAEAAIPIALALAVRLRAGITLLHVLEHDAPAEVHGDPHLRRADAAAAYLEAIAARLRDEAGPGVPVDPHVHDNPEHDVARSIIQHAEEFANDLIVLANHGRGGWRELLVGTIAQKVVRQGDRPVFMVPAREHAAPTPYECRSIAVALSGEAEAEVAIAPTAALALAFGAPVHLISAVPTLSTLTGERTAVAAFTPGSTRAALDLEEAETRAYLQSVARAYGELGIFADATVVRGTPATEILAAADRQDAQLLVLATHGRSGISAIWTGSVGTKVLGRATRPLLLVRSPD